MAGHTRVDGGSCHIDFDFSDVSTGPKTTGASSRRGTKGATSKKGTLSDKRGVWLRVAYDDGENKGTHFINLRKNLGKGKKPFAELRWFETPDGVLKVRPAVATKSRPSPRPRKSRAAAARTR